MAVKKTELYSSLWASCDALRGGMDASQYKDYILTLLFMKYVTDKYKGQKYGDLTVFDKANDPNPDPEKRTGCSFDDFIALKNKKNIGEGIDKIIARLAEVNEGLKGVIDIAHFNDEAKIGKDKEMVDKLTKLIAIFQRPELDFSKNKVEGDDIIGDAYEYLMRNFASESGKSKGQFYTPAEVSRILAKIIGIDNMYDPDKIHPEKLTFSNYDEDAVKKCNVEWGDIFLTRSSLKPEGIAESNVLLDSGRFVYDDHLIRLKLDKEKYDPFFVKLNLSGSIFKRQFIARAKTTAFTTIGQEDIAECFGLFPEKEEQEKIGTYFSNLDHLITFHQCKSDKYSNIKKGMMSDLLTGKIRLV